MGKCWHKDSFHRRNSQYIEEMNCWFRISQDFLESDHEMQVENIKFSSDKTTEILHTEAYLTSHYLPSVHLSSLANFNIDNINFDDC